MLVYHLIILWPWKSERTSLYLCFISHKKPSTTHLIGRPWGGVSDRKLCTAQAASLASLWLLVTGQLTVLYRGQSQKQGITNLSSVSYLTGLFSFNSSFCWWQSRRYHHGCLQTGPYFLPVPYYTAIGSKPFWLSRCINVLMVAVFFFYISVTYSVNVICEMSQIYMY